MKKSLKYLFAKIGKINSRALEDGFKVLKNVRGGILPNSGCTNVAGCNGTNSDHCQNDGSGCAETTNVLSCTNTGCFQ